MKQFGSAKADYNIIHRKSRHNSWLDNLRKIWGFPCVYLLLVVQRTGSVKGVGHVNQVVLRRARLILEWMTLSAETLVGST